MTENAPLLTQIRALPMVESTASVRAVSLQGKINRSFVVEQGDQSLLVKYLCDPLSLPVDRRGQFDLQANIAAYGLAPKPLYLSDDADIWVEQWCTAKPYKDTGDVSILVQALASLHSLADIGGVALDLPFAWQTYLSALPIAEQGVFESAIEKAQVIWRQDHRKYWVCCHHDLSFAHLLLAQPPILLDWEYAAMGNRFYDLASCVLVNQLTKPQQKTLIAGYASACGFADELVYQQVQRQLPLAQLTSELWYAAVKFSG